MMIAVTFALPAESKEFLRCLSNKSQIDRNDIRVIRGKIDDRTIEVVHTGVGAKVCRQRMGKFLQDQQFDCLISAGFAGALNDQLQVGDLVLAENFSTVDPSEKHSSLSSLSLHFDIERQGTHIVKLAMFLLAHPNRVPRLIKFARSIAQARKILANALVLVATAL